MAKRPTINTLANTASPTYLTQLNQNFTNIRDQFDNTLSLDGSTPNAMNADIDLNGNDLLNANSVNTATLRIGGENVVASAATALAVKKEFETVALLLADTGTYTNYGAGDYLRVVNGGFTYQVAASGASDHHVTTAGGVKLYVLTGDLRAFGAVGDGVADDTAKVLAALNAGFGVIDGANKTYKLTANIAPTCENIVIQNAAFDISAITTGGSAISFAGTQAAGVALTSDTLAGSNAIAVGSTTGFSAEDYAWLSSGTTFETAGSVALGQVVKIKSVDSATAMTLYNDVLYDFTTAATATIAKITPKQNITVRGVKVIGANTGNQVGLDFEKCVNVLVDDCSFDYVDYISILFDRCIDATVTNSAMRYARAVGLSYGVSVSNGCYNVKVSDCYGEDQRHMVTVGDNDGVNLFVSVTNCHAAAQRDAGLDSHSAGDFILFDGNTIECVGAEVDGIICQGLNCVISNNIIVGNIRSGIRHQLLPEIGTGSCVIIGNSIENYGQTASTDSAIFVEQVSGGGASMESVVISGNRIDGAIEQGIYVYASSGNVKNLAITGNVMTSDASLFACYVRAAAGYSVEDFTITGNVFKCAGVSNIYLLGTTSPNILNGTISGNTIKGGTNGIRLVQAQNVVETGNYNTGVTRKVFVDTGSSNIAMDRRQSSVVTFTNSTYTVLDQDEYLIANRAGTITVTLPAAANWPGRELRVKTIQAQAVDSASSNVVPIGDSVAGTSILPATDGAWSLLKSDGTNWVVMQRGT